MQYLYFEIKNFKGIVHVRLDFTPRQKHNIYTLVGLNESGKTTILEGFNFTRHKDDNLDPLNLPGYSIKDVRDVIPISKIANFNDNIEITSAYILEDKDQKSIKEFLLKSCNFHLAEDVKNFAIIQSYEFRDSALVSPQPPVIWTIKFRGKYGRSKKIVEIHKDHWKQAVIYIKTLLPSILYFPNFLFEFPERIYLDDVEVDAKKHEFYRIILQDIMNATGENLKLQDHIVDRIRSGDSYQIRAMESVLARMGSHISKTVFTAWDNILQRQAGHREIDIKHGLDEGKIYLQLRLKEGDETYEISERSLGFRWFFAFLLSTKYREYRKNVPGNVLFLFDEPASNLHSAAQQQLLESFKDFPKESSVIYTTHSHHMINPDWLENTFVVKNEGLDYTSRDDNYSSKKTRITLHKYRMFASQHPEQSTYFQPILDVLDYRPSKLENIPYVVMIEGKNDFYILKYFHEKILSESNSLNFMPGNGAGSLDNLIRMYLAWGREFIVILDSDKTGTEEKKRYENIFGILVEQRIFSLSDIDISWSGKGMEYLIDESQRLLIQRTIYQDINKYKKRLFNRAIQELYASSQTVALPSETMETFKKITNFCTIKLNRI